MTSKASGRPRRQSCQLSSAQLSLSFRRRSVPEWKDIHRRYGLIVCHRMPLMDAEKCRAERVNWVTPTFVPDHLADVAAGATLTTAACSHPSQQAYLIGRSWTLALVREQPPPPARPEHRGARARNRSEELPWPCTHGRNSAQDTKIRRHRCRVARST